jgi:hypothetical protein
MANSLPSRITLSCAVFFSMLWPASAQSHQTTVQLTVPTNAALQVTQSVPQVSLTKPYGPAAVPNPISSYDYEAHMNFQHNEDMLTARIDLVGSLANQRLDVLKLTVDEDHKDIGSLKETRSSWQAYLVVGGLIWGLVTSITGWLNKDKFLNWIRRLVGPGMEGPSPS